MPHHTPTCMSCGSIRLTLILIGQCWLRLGTQREADPSHTVFAATHHEQKGVDDDGAGMDYLGIPGCMAGLAHTQAMPPGDRADGFQICVSRVRLLGRPSSTSVAFASQIAGITPF